MPATNTDEISVDSSMIARVLGRAHHTAEVQNAPDEARTILRLVQLFADELASADPRFDRRRFIQTAKEAKS